MIENKRGRLCAPRAVGAAFALLLGAVGSGHPALAQSDQPDASRPEVSESKWIKRCSGTEADAFCEISFGKMVTFRDKQIWVAVAGLFERGDQRDMFIFTPLGSALRRGIAFRVDTSEAKTAQFSVCLQVQGCQAIVSAEAGLIEQMKTGNELQVQFSLGNRPPVTSTVTLSGFTAAYEGVPEVIVEAPDEAAPQAGSQDTSGGKGDAVVQ
jgi:invasion protein IalB